jgi:hypothetical protein
VIALGSLLANDRVRKLSVGLGLCAVAVSAVLLQKWVSYREGFRDGVANERTIRQHEAAIAKAAADSAWAVLFAQATAARDAQRVAEQSVARARARSAAAEARLEDALAAVRVDTLEMPSSCTALADSCANAAALWGHERDTLSALIAAQDTIVMRQTAMIATEPQRLSDAMRAALARQRETFKGPSRLRWASIGAVLGAVVMVFR